MPRAERSLQVRLMVCAHMQAGHGAICAAIHRLGAYCVWEEMKEEEFLPETFQKSVAGWVTVQEELQRKVFELVRADRDRKHVAASAEHAGFRGWGLRVGVSRQNV